MDVTNCDTLIIYSDIIEWKMTPRNASLSWSRKDQIYAKASQLMIKSNYSWNTNAGRQSKRTVKIDYHYANLSLGLLEVVASDWSLKQNLICKLLSSISIENTAGFNSRKKSNLARNQSVASWMYFFRRKILPKYLGFFFQNFKHCLVLA